MKKVLLIPDSFKGTMRSEDICEIMKQVIAYHYPDAEILSLPVADGGEGSVDCFLAAVGGDKIAVTVKGPYFEELVSYYGMLPDGTAVIEMAAAAGLPLVGDRLAPDSTTTYGVGQLIEHALKSGAKQIVIGLGGSATNDGGAGAAAALGVNFFDKDGVSFIPVGATLKDISSISMANVLSELSEVPMTVMCDIDNPLCGPFGAAAMFGPQKGANREMVQSLDEGLFHYAEVLKRELGADIMRVPGSAAAGGMGGGLMAFFNAPLNMGIETVLDTIRFDDLLEGADLVITGEGKIDAQSLRGKVVIGVARRTKEKGVPLLAVVGSADDNMEEAYREGVTSVFTINRMPMPSEQAFKRTRENIALTVDNIMRFMKSVTPNHT